MSFELVIFKCELAQLLIYCSVCLLILMQATSHFKHNTVDLAKKKRHVSNTEWKTDGINLQISSKRSIVRGISCIFSSVLSLFYYGLTRKQWVKKVHIVSHLNTHGLQISSQVNLTNLIVISKVKKNSLIRETMIEFPPMYIILLFDTYSIIVIGHSY